MAGEAALSLTESERLARLEQLVVGEDHPGFRRLEAVEQELADRKNSYQDRMRLLRCKEAELEEHIARLDACLDLCADLASRQDVLAGELAIQQQVYSDVNGQIAHLLDTADEADEFLGRLRRYLKSVQMATTLLTDDSPRTTGTGG